MLALHLALFWFAVALAAKRWAKTPKGYWWVTVIFAAYPPVLGMIGIVWKDIGFGAACLAGTLLLLGRTKRWEAVLAFVFYFYALSLRLNAATAMVPLFFLFVSDRSIWTRIGRGLALFAACLVLTVLVQRLLIKDHRDHPVQQILLYDLAAVSLAVGKDYFPPYLRGVKPEFSLEWVKSVHHPIDAGGITNSGVLVKDATQVDSLKKAWFEAVTSHPLEYWAHRNTLFRFLMSLNSGASETYTLGFWDAEPFPKVQRIRLQDQLLNRIVGRWLETFNRSLVFSNGVYFMGLPLLIWLALILGRLRTDMVWIAMSGYFYTWAYFFVGTAGNFRYSWWTVLAALVVFGEVFLRESKQTR